MTVDAAPLIKAVVRKPYTGKLPDELTVNVGDELEIAESIDPRWFIVRI